MKMNEVDHGAFPKTVSGSGYERITGGEISVFPDW
jgi:hypothetical protein